MSVTVGIPGNNSATSQDLLMNVTCPAGNGWVSWGFGDSMANSLMFVAYESSDGNSIIVSPRLATGHSQPQLTSDVGAIVYESSVAERGWNISVYCSNCRSWKTSPSSLQLTSGMQSVVWAVGNGSPIKSDDKSATIEQHSNQGTASLDLATAANAVSNAQKNGGSSGTTAAPAPTTTADTSNSGAGSSSGAADSASVRAHAFFMVAAFLFIFPVGVLARKIFNKLWPHTAIQSIGGFFVILGSAAGIYASQKHQIVRSKQHLFQHMID